METINGISLYPNPATVNVKVSAAETIKEISVITIAGKEVIKRSDINKMEEWIRVALLPEGLYNVRIVTQSNTFATLLYKSK